MKYSFSFPWILILVLPACASPAPEEELDSDGRDRQCAGCGDSPWDGKTDAAQDPLSVELTEKYGVRPRRYAGLFKGESSAQRKLMRGLPEVTRFVNTALAAQGYSARVTETELATNFITEGGFFALNWNQTENLDGFAYFGIDTVVDNYAALKPYLHSSIRTLVEAGKNNLQTVNEKGEQVTSLQGLTLLDGLYANAGMWAWSKAVVEDDLRTLKKTAIDTLAAHVQFFWTTFYFNAGSGTGRKNLIGKGVDYVSVKWPRADDATLYGRCAQFNALWRTASFEYLGAKVFASGSTPTPPPDESCGDKADNDKDQLIDCLDDDCASSSLCANPAELGTLCGGASGCTSGLCFGYCTRYCSGDDDCAGGPAGTFARCLGDAGNGKIACLVVCQKDGSQTCPSGLTCQESSDPATQICLR